MAMKYFNGYNFDKNIESKMNKKLIEVQSGINVTHISMLYCPRKLQLIASNGLN